MSKRIISQNYPRIYEKEDKYYGFLNESALKEHVFKITSAQIKEVIINAIEKANTKSGRAILEIPESATDEEIQIIYKQKGKELFSYFQKYCGDPASTAFECLGRHFSQIGREQFRNRTLQKERMNSGWRYQFIAKDAAQLSKRFTSISDIGAAEADFNAIIAQKSTHEHINIYVSVKNRTNTMGGQDWPKAIRALEEVAKNDKNRTGPYICVFGIAMEKGFRNIKNEAKTKTPYSFNTEIWLSDFFWPFFSNYSYEEIIKAVLEVLINFGENSILDVEIPQELLESFGKCCQDYKLLDDKGCFNDAYKLVELFCGKLKNGNK